jgi:hypothetical protein
VDKAHLYEYVKEKLKEIIMKQVSEGKWIIERYKKLYGTPYKKSRKIHSSIDLFLWVKRGWKRKIFKNISLRMYTDFDVEWLMKERHRDLYD